MRSQLRHAGARMMYEPQNFKGKSCDAGGNDAVRCLHRQTSAADWSSRSCSHQSLGISTGGRQRAHLLAASHQVYFETKNHNPD